MRNSVAAHRLDDRFGELAIAAYDARCAADRMRHASGDATLGRAVRRLDEAAAELERAASQTGRPALRLV